MYAPPQAPMPARKPPRWVIWTVGMSVVIVLLICSCVGILAYIGSSLPPEVRTSMNATATARAVAATIPTSSSVEVAAAQNNTSSSDKNQTAPTELATAAEPTTTPLPATNAPSPTSTIVPTSTPIPPTNTPAPPPTTTVPAVEVVDVYKSGGLGLSQSSWEQQHGQPGRDIGGLIFYENEAFLVGYQNSNVWHLEQSWSNDGISLQEASALSKLLIPADSKLVKTYETQLGYVVDLYKSASLKSRFPATTKIGDLELSMWPEGEPGNFIVSYDVNKGRVSRIVLGLGNNP